MLAGDSVDLGQVRVDGGGLHWLERRPAEAGRQVVVQWQGQAPRDRLPAPFSARNKVHEYGGGDYLVHGDCLYFANAEDQRLYRLGPADGPEALTPEGPYRYADLAADAVRERLIAVREEHVEHGPPHNTLVAVPLENDAPPEVLCRGMDFYAAPRVSPDGRRLCWLEWNLPGMPWDGCVLRLAELLPGGDPGPADTIAGGPGESILQPEWSPDGVLHFVSDRSGWWNLHAWENGRITALAPMEAELGEPAWVFGQSSYAFSGTEAVIAAHNRGGYWRLSRIDRLTGEIRLLELPFTRISSVRAEGGRACFVAASPRMLPAVCLLDLDSLQCRILRASSGAELDARLVSEARALEFPGHGGRTSHLFYFPPAAAEYTAPPEERPPLIVRAHGGPTSAAGPELDLSVQFWTSRGFALAYVNFAGSTGYGRAYRERLNGLWGIADVEDCVRAAAFLTEKGLADKARMAVTGGSSGGFTALCALAFHKVFGAGASHYGVADLEALARDTHKFESHYLDRLVAPYPAGEAIYRERSPVHYAGSISRPVILLQGGEDKVVPPGQSEAMYRALKERGVPAAFVLFEGEGHGFRKAENRKRARLCELYFYRRVFAIPDPENLEPVRIENL